MVRGTVKEWLKKRRLVDRATLVNDLSAGLTLGIVSIPDAMASALLALVNPVFGIYAVMLATPIGAIFASSVFMSVQTTSAMSLVVASIPQVHQGEGTAGALFMLTVLTGVIMLILGLFKLGSLLRFVPNSVLTGFINGVAVLIVLGQLDNLTGYASSGGNRIARTFDLLLHLGQVDVRSLAVGVVTIILIVVLNITRLKKLSMVVALVAASLLVPLFSWMSVALVRDIADIPGSLPGPVLPALSMIPELLIPALSLAFVGLVQGAGISKNYANPDGTYPDPSGDFVGQGVANLPRASSRACLWAGLFPPPPSCGAVAPDPALPTSLPGSPSLLPCFFSAAASRRWPCRRWPVFS